MTKWELKQAYVNACNELQESYWGHIPNKVRYRMCTELGCTLDQLDEEIFMLPEDEFDEL